MIMKLGSLFKKRPKGRKDDRRDEHIDLGAEGGPGEPGRVSDAEALAIQEAMAHALPIGVDVETKMEDEEGKLTYMVRVSNNTDDIMGDVNIAIAPNRKIVSCPKPKGSVKFIDPGKKEIFRFPLIPTYKSGKTTIQGLLRYFDFNEKAKQEYMIPDYDLNISSPDITPKEVNEDIWRVTMGKLVEHEIETEEMNFEPEKVFSHLTKIAKRMGFYPLAPVVTPTLFRGLGKFFGLDALKEPYCMEIQVIGKGKKSRLLLRTWSDSKASSMGIAFRLLGKVDKRLEIRSKIVQKNDD